MHSTDRLSRVDGRKQLRDVVDVPTSRSRTLRVARSWRLMFGSRACLIDDSIESLAGTNSVYR